MTDKPLCFLFVSFSFDLCVCVLVPLFVVWSLEGFTTGYRNASAHGANNTVWTAFKHATVAESDNFALYPLWPSETLNAIDQVAVSADLRAIAQRSLKTYADLQKVVLSLVHALSLSLSHT